MASVDFLTVATVDYTPQALATLRSARRTGNYLSYQYFALDAAPGTATKLREMLGEDATWISVFGPEDLLFEREKYLAAFAYYNPFELACFAKYLAAAYVIGRAGAADFCLYADSDILFTGDASVALEEIGSDAAMLTPHQLTAASSNAEAEYNALGWLNAGFFCLSARHSATFPMLKWLVDRIARAGFNAPAQGEFVDQIWLSALGFAFPNQVRLSTHPGMNVAYWNLGERPLSRDGAITLSQGKPLLFFHFSGFKPASTSQLSTHAAVPVQAGSILNELCAAYRLELEGANATAGAACSLPRLPCCREPLETRLRNGEKVNGPRAASPAMPGNRLASAIRRVLSWLRC